MKQLRRLFFVFALAVFALPGVAFSADKATSGLIATIMVEGDHFYVALVGSPYLCNEANSDGNRRTAAVEIGHYGITADSMRMAHAQLVAAFLAGRSVTVHAYNNSAGGCLGSNIQLSAQ